MSAIAEARVGGSHRALKIGRASLVAIVGAGIATTAVELAGKGLGADHATQLRPSTYLPLVVIGVVLGAVAWQATAARVANPRRTLGRLVPAVLALSFVPDGLLGAAGTAWSAVATLMVMHLAVAVIAVPVFLVLLPLHNAADEQAPRA